MAVTGIGVAASADPVVALVAALNAATSTYVHGQVRNASGVLDATKQAIIVLDANGDIDDIQIETVS